jgi:hypothetical protein
VPSVFLAFVFPAAAVCVPGLSACSCERELANFGRHARIRDGLELGIPSEWQIRGPVVMSAAAKHFRVKSCERNLLPRRLKLTPRVEMEGFIC